MHKTDMRGGADEYKISEVLGPNFKQFVGLLKSGGLEQFTFGTFGDTSATGTAGAAKPNDVHYDFTQTLIASAAAFRQIEKPDISKVEVAGKYANEIYDIFEELTKNVPTSGIVDVPTSEFGFYQLPHHPSVPHLSTGFHLFPYTKEIYYNHDAAVANGLVNAVKYLYHFLSLLDLNNFDVRNVMALLRTDNLGFMPYVNDIVKSLSGTDYFDKEINLPAGADRDTVIRTGVLAGLSAVAVQIANALRQTPAAGQDAVPAVSAAVNNLQNLDLTKEAEVKPFIKSIGLNDEGDKIYTAFKAFGVADKRGFGANASKAVPDAKQLETYAKNALHNPLYVQPAIVEESVDSKDVDLPAESPLRQRGGAKRNSYQRGGAGLRPVGVAGAPVVSLPFLYGPPTPPDAAGASKSYLVTSATQGTEAVNAELASLAAAKALYTVDTGANNALGGLIGELSSAGTPDNASINQWVC